ATDLIVPHFPSVRFALAIDYNHGCHWGLFGNWTGMPCRVLFRKRQFSCTGGPRCTYKRWGRPLMAWTDPDLWYWLFFLSEWAIRLAMLVVVPFRRTPAAAKGWLLLIFFEPWVGLLLYLLIGRARLTRWQRAQLARLPQAMAGVAHRLANDPNVFHPEVGPALSRAVTLAENLGGMPILGGNAVELLSDYDGPIARLVAATD